MKTRFIWKKSCDTCRRFKKQLDAWGVDYDGREMNAEPLNSADIDELMGTRPVKPFLNTRNAVYRERKLGQNQPSRTDAIKLIAETNNLLKRPVLIVGDEYVIGNDLARAEALLKE
jgi:arsenate reductase-like glutaredoxin family protein